MYSCQAACCYRQFNSLNQQQLELSACFCVDLIVPWLAAAGKIDCKTVRLRGCLLLLVHHTVLHVHVHKKSSLLPSKKVTALETPPPPYGSLGKLKSKGTTALLKVEARCLFYLLKVEAGAFSSIFYWPVVCKGRYLPKRHARVSLGYLPYREKRRNVHTADR